MVSEAWNCVACSSLSFRPRRMSGMFFATEAASRAFAASFFDPARALRPRSSSPRRSSLRFSSSSRSGVHPPAGFGDSSAMRFASRSRESRATFEYASISPDESPESSIFWRCAFTDSSLKSPGYPSMSPSWTDGEIICFLYAVLPELSRSPNTKPNSPVFGSMPPSIIPIVLPSKPNCLLR